MHVYRDSTSDNERINAEERKKKRRMSRQTLTWDTVAGDEIFCRSETAAGRTDPGATLDARRAARATANSRVTPRRPRRARLHVAFALFVVVTRTNTCGRKLRNLHSLVNYMQILSLPLGPASPLSQQCNTSLFILRGNRRTCKLRARRLLISDAEK